MKQELMTAFLVRAAIPEVKEKDKLPRNKGRAEKSNLIWDAVYRAHRDVLTGRKNVSAYSQLHKIIRTTKSGEAVFGPNDVAQALYYKIKASNKSKDLSSQKLIDYLQSEFKIVPYGVLQKLVNMTMKYLFILQAFSYLQEYNIPEICEEECDCPLDSIILEKLKKSDVKWTNLESEAVYRDIQGTMTQDGRAKTKLEYDFLYYQEFQECPW